MTSPAPAARPQVATWSPSQTGPCTKWSVDCTNSVIDSTQWRQLWSIWARRIR